MYICKKSVTMERKKEGFTNQRAIVLPEAIKKILVGNELTNLLYVTDIGYYPHATGHYRARRYGSQQHILIYCTEGEGWYSIHGQRQKVCKDQFFIIEAGLPHIYAASENSPWSIYWLHFTGEKSHLFNSFYNKLHKIDESPNARIKDRMQLFEEIYQNLEMGYSIENLEYTTLCLWHFIASFKFVSQFREINRAKQGDVTQEAISYMRKNIEKKLSLDDIAGSVNYSSSHFGQVFLKKSGYTPLNYFNQLKIQKACQLLDFSDLKIKEIAEQLGFYDQYHFSKVFYKQIGETPSSYKKRNKG